jgi:hypothetical protein
MATFEQQYMASQANVHAQKVRATTLRVLAVQARAKIKPAALRPCLLNTVRHSDLRGGDVIESQAKNDFFYYPSTVSFSRNATTQSTESGREPLTPDEWVNSVENAYNRSEAIAEEKTLDRMGEAAGFPSLPTQSAQDVDCGMGIRF